MKKEKKKDNEGTGALFAPCEDTRSCQSAA